MNVYEHVFQSISGISMPLDNWTGQPILIVNTASECGYTPQLTKLQKLYNDYRQSGLVVIGIPCNDFGAQEPDDEETIYKRYWNDFGVRFALTRKMSVMGRDAHPLFLEIRDAFGSDYSPRWNFHKYLFNTQGNLAEHWASGVEPNDPLLTHQVERTLQSWII